MSFGVSSGGALTLAIEELGPVRSAKLLLGDLTLLIGSPNSGKSYTLRAVYSELSALDKHLLHLCKPRLPSSVIRLASEGLRLLAVAVAAAVEAALNPDTAPSRIAKGYGVTLSRYTVRERSSSPRRGEHYIWVEFRIGRDSRRPLAYTEPGSIVEAIIEGFYGCVRGSLIPRHSSFRVREARSAIELAARKGLGVALIELLRDLSIQLDGCEASIESLKAEVSASQGRVELRGVDIAASIPATCRLSERLVDKVSVALDSSASRDSITSNLLRGLARLGYRAVRSALARSTGVRDVLYVPFAKSLALSLYNAVGIDFVRVKRLVRLLENKETLQLALFIERLNTGVKRYVEHDAFAKPELNHVASLLVNGFPEVQERRLLYHDKRRKAIVPIHLASALATETLALLFALNSLENGGSLILLEEPETQLHPRLQVAMGITVAALTSMLNSRIVVTTHSDLLASTLALISHYKPRADILAEMLAEATGQSRDNESVRLIARHASTLADKTLRIYLFDDDGRVTPLTPAKLLEEMPSLGKASDIVLRAIIQSIPESAEHTQTVP